MSQPGQPPPPPAQDVGNSSNVSASVEQAPSSVPVVDADDWDPAWAHCFIPNISKNHHLQCNYCGKICTAGITRVKVHLAGIKRTNVAKCLKDPTAVKKEYMALLAQNHEANVLKFQEAERVRAKIDIDHSGGEGELGEDCDCYTGNDVVVLNSNNNSRAGVVGPMDTFCRPTIEESVKRNQKDKGIAITHKVQTKISTQKREEMRDRVYEYICQFFYEASIAHNAVTLPSFAYIIVAIGAFGRGLKGPSAYEMGGPFFQKRKKKVMEGFNDHKETWEHTRCTIMTNAWTDRKGRGVMNLVVHSAHEVLFLDSVDCSSVKKDGKYIFDLVDRCIEDIGEDKVIQVVIDNASVNTAAATLMKAKRPHIFWNGCAARTIDLILEDIGKLGLVEQTITKARQVTVFLYAHTRVLALMRKFLGRDLVRSGVTKFATTYLNLKSMQENKKELKKLFKSDELEEMRYLRKVKGKKTNKVVQCETFWKGVDTAVNFFESMANVLRRMDSDVPAMGFFYGCTVDAKREIAERFNNDGDRIKEVMDIIDKRWDNKLKTPLHMAGYYLNPYYYYPNKLDIEMDGQFRAGVVTCITKMIKDEAIQDKILDELNYYEDQFDSFGRDIATRQRRNKNFDPAKWWLNHGTSSPNLRNLATKILNLTCSSSACERNWSAFEQVHVKRRSRLLHDRMRDLVFVKFNSKLKQKREDKMRDPIRKPIDDVLEDAENEFIHVIVPNAAQDNEDAEPVPAQPQGASSSQAQAKRKRHVHHRRKKRKKSIHSLLNNLDDPALSSSSESKDIQDGDTEMRNQSSESDKSLSAGSDSE